jgi:hypothetical protein
MSDAPGVGSGVCRRKVRLLICRTSAHLSPSFEFSQLRRHVSSTPRTGPFFCVAANSYFVPRATVPWRENSVLSFQHSRCGLATGLTLGESDHDISVRARGNHG